MFTAQASVLLASAVAFALAAATACGPSESSSTGGQGEQPQPSGGAVAPAAQGIRERPATPRRYGPFAIDAAVEGGLNPDALAPDGARPAWCNAISNQGQCAWSH
jgi:hypothetical protein